ncbi:FRG domain-containing protein [Insolitispirillum peregrinum]|uniref:FRG domain-containing protein n=1 Tax=Insolitispirillum peregrinum TaxID=80876 RepID=A0A1N7PKK6_9PROT|nr:FRG domain-containing protein [Insolitispirillum peregrinum]SIT11193.1 FRG domain-containing protein [Insolitispirillum peregrinum]
MARPKIHVSDNIWDILKEIEKWGQDDGKHTVYRGHTDYRHKLRPSLFRSQNERMKNNERNVLRELITKHPIEFSSDVGIFEKLVRMQHYGLPTRLLDVTYNPLVAIYFACEKCSKYDAEIIAIRVDPAHFKYFDSDTVRCISNLSNLSQSEIKGLNSVADSSALNASESGKRLHDFVMQERPNFQPRIDKKHLSDFYLVEPRLNNPRIQAQKGAFLIFGLEEELKAGTNGFEIKKFRIDKNKTTEIRRNVEMLGFSESNIYPELSKTADMIKRKYEAN